MHAEIVFLLGIALFVNAFPDGDLDSLIASLGPPGPGQNKAPAPNSGATNAHPSDEDVSCTLESGEEGICVSYYLCNANESLNTDGVGIIDIRFGNGPCENYMDTCCRVSEKSEVPITPKPPALRTTGCGIRNENGIGFRIKGDRDNEAQFGEFPWMVAILREEPLAADKTQRLNVYQCGGSLIHPKVVLTAAHCVAAASKEGGPKLKIRVGEWDTQTKKELLPYQDKNVVKIIKHEHYYAGALYNDVALLFLESAVDEAENVGVICLPPPSKSAPLAKCVASGWGKDVFGKEGKYQVILKKVELPIVPNDKCEKSLRKTRLGSHFELHQSFICAGGEKGKDTCKGDGGSPLVCPVPNYPGHYMQSGIVAWGIGCGENLTPGVYANVAYLREWIDDHLTLNNIDMKPYSLH